MKRIHRNPIALVLAVVMVLSFFMPMLQKETHALRYSGSASYESGKFYRALTRVALTGDPRVDLVNIAKSQVGYQEGGSSNQLSGEVYGGVNFTEYGRWYGLQDMWCAMFASWCARTAGISSSVIPSHSFTPNGLQWFRDRGQAFSRAQVAAGEYTPQPGDLIYFKSPRNTNSTNHVGIVTGYSNGTVYTVEGNIGSVGSVSNGGMVAALSYPISNTYIVYICCPAYPGSSTNVQKQADMRMNALLDAIYTVETGGEADYDAFGIQGTSVTIGSGQWQGLAARDLLVKIRNADEETFKKLDTAGIGEDLDSLNWSTYLVAADSEKGKCIQSILSSDTGIFVQDECLKDRLYAYYEEAEDLGINGSAGCLMYAGLRHVYGARTVNALLETAENPNADTLHATMDGDMVSTTLYQAIMDCYW